MVHGERAWQYAKQLAFPRLVGHPGERQAAEVVTGAFKALGYDVTVFPFPVFRTPWGWVRIGLSVSLILLIGAGVAGSFGPVYAVLCCAGAIAVPGLMASFWGRLAQRDPSPDTAPHTSSNIVARSRSQCPSLPKLTLYLIAHHDSKSQSVSLPLRIILIIVCFLGCLVYGTAHLVVALYPAFAQWSGNQAIHVCAVAFWLLGIASGLILLGVRTENRSPGGLDNAGSAGVLLALAETLRNEEFRNIEIVFVSTGAEELGLLGSYALLRAWRPRLDRKRSWFLNFDLLGRKGALRMLEGVRPLWRPHSPYARLIRRIAERQNIPLRSQPMLPGALLDHIPFSQQGFQATSLISVSKHTGYVHTERDTIDLVDPDGLEEAGRLVEAVIRELENELNREFQENNQTGRK